MFRTINDGAITPKVVFLRRRDSEGCVSHELALKELSSRTPKGAIGELLWSGEWRSFRFEAFEKGTKIHANTKEAMNTESLVSVVHHLE